jgi:diguanylate cyclase (GGDEF)-like protein
MIDIDQFGRFNKFGYSLGDEVIREFSALLLKLLPKNIILARFRIGDEFIIVFKNMNVESASRHIDHIKTQCKDQAFNSLQLHPGQSVSFSAGVVESGNNLNTLEAILLEAERLLKEKKLSNS